MPDFFSWLDFTYTLKKTCSLIPYVFGTTVFCFREIYCSKCAADLLLSYSTALVHGCIEWFDLSLEAGLLGVNANTVQLPLKQRQCLNEL